MCNTHLLLSTVKRKKPTPFFQMGYAFAAIGSGTQQCRCAHDITAENVTDCGTKCKGFETSDLQYYCGSSSSTEKAVYQLSPAGEDCWEVAIEQRAFSFSRFKFLYDMISDSLHSNIVTSHCVGIYNVEPMGSHLGVFEGFEHGLNWYLCSKLWREVCLMFLTWMSTEDQVRSPNRFACMPLQVQCNRYQK